MISRITFPAMRFTHYTLPAVWLLIGSNSAAQTPPEPNACGVLQDVRASALSESRRSLERALSVVTAQQSYLFRGASHQETVCDGGYTFLSRWTSNRRGESLEVLPIQASVVNNSTYARSINDAAAWNGAGLTIGAHGGVRGNWKFLSAQLAPEVYLQENASFDYVPNPFFGFADEHHPYHVFIDYPTRFGSGSFTTIAAGQSYLQAGYKNVSATVGTENLWIGAADVHPILLSYTAPGFPHLRIGTQRPLDIKVARLEFQMLFGSMRESEYFDGNPDNDDHYFGATMLVVEPKFAPGLYLGIIRAVHDTAQAFGQGPGFYLSRNVRTFFGSTAGGNLGSDNGIGVLLARWVHPASAFEVYAEWGREDTPGGWVDVLREPDWTQAYVLGVQKVFAQPTRMTRVYAELTHLGESAPARAGRGFVSFYTHSTVIQGHTNEGQLLGAAIGPGSDAQLIGVDVFSGSGRSAFRIERTRYDDDTYYRTFARRWGETRHDAEISLSASRMQFLGSLEVEAGVTFSRRYGRQFIPLFVEGEDLVENNWQTKIVAAWNPF